MTSQDFGEGGNRKGMLHIRAHTPGQEPPDVGLAPSTAWRDLPLQLLVLADPSLKPQPFPPRSAPPFSPHPPGSFCNAPGEGGAGEGS